MENLQFCKPLTLLMLQKNVNDLTNHYQKYLPLIDKTTGTLQLMTLIKLRSLTNGNFKRGEEMY